MSRTQEERAAQRLRGPLIPSGNCHFCGYKVPPKAHWCSGDCAKEYTAEGLRASVPDGKLDQSGL